MKYILITIATFLMASCTTDLEVTGEVSTFVDINFTGVYLCTFDCEGALEDANGENCFLKVTRDPISSIHTLSLGDDVMFEGEIVNNELVIEEQTLNEEYDFDVVTLSGRIFQNQDETFTFEFEHEVDDEGKSTCTMLLEKQ